MNIAREVARRSTCLRRKFGAVVVKNDVIVSTGYVGAPRSTRDCFERGECLRDKLNIPHGQRYELCRSVHSEMNAIINAARSGASILGGTMYIWGADLEDNIVNAFPCFMCKKMIINAGLKDIVCSLEGGGWKRFFIEDWVREWQKGDIIEDKYQYGR